MSDTPRTNKTAQHIRVTFVDWHHSATMMMEQAVELERELTTERAAREQAEARLAEALNIIKAYDGCRCSCGGERTRQIHDDENCPVGIRNKFLSSTAPPPILDEVERLRALLECQRIDLSKVGSSFKQFWVKAQASPVYWQEAAALADDEYRRSESELAALKAELADTVAEIKVLRTEIVVLQAERDALKLKLEAAKGALELACVASCSCQNKTPDYEYHSESCRYKALEKVLTQLNAP